MSEEFEVKLIELSKSFSEVKALNNFSLEMAKGELVALLGPSGCGKTTALRALAGLQQLDSGKIIVHGKDITDLPTNKRNMGMVFQSYSLFPHMSALENVEYGLKMRFRKVSNAERQKKSKELLDLVDWLEMFHPNSMVELDYGGLANYLELALAEEGGLEADTSIEDIQSSIAGLAVGDGALAGRGYERLVTRWRKVSAFESAS